jgi:hypothetical protein
LFCWIFAVFALPPLIHMNHPFLGRRINKARHNVTGLIFDETDGSRTRNLRIDSPVL